MKPLHPLSILITTNNEASDIGACLDTVSWADEYLVIDSFSTDETVEIAKTKGAIVHQRPYEGPSDQKNWGITQAANEWILILDADERVPPALRGRIQSILAQKEIPEDAFWIDRQNYFLGKKIKYSGWQNDKVVRLVRRSKCRYNDKQVHEEIITEGLSMGHIHEKMDHYTYKSMQHFLQKMDRYAQWSAKDHDHKTTYIGVLQLYFKPLYRFVQHYFLKLGFLDGKGGFIISTIMAWGVFLRYAYLLDRRSRPSD